MAKVKNKYIYGSAAEEINYQQPEQQSQAVSYDPYEENALLRSKKIARNNIKLKRKIVLSIFLIFGMCAIIMFRYAQISQLSYETNKLKNQYTAMQNENAKVLIDIEKAMDLNSIRDIAEIKLGMHKPDKSQVTYVSVPKEDKTILASKEQSKALVVAKSAGNSLKKFLSLFY